MQRGDYVRKTEPSDAGSPASNACFTQAGTYTTKSAERLTRPPSCLYSILPVFFVYTLSDQYREAVRFLLLAPLGTKTGLKPSRDQSQSRPLSFEKGSGPVLFEKNRSHPDTQPRRKTKQTPREEVVCVFPSRKRAAKRTKNQRFKQILGTSSKPGG